MLSRGCNTDWYETPSTVPAVCPTDFEASARCVTACILLLYSHKGNIAMKQLQHKHVVDSQPLWNMDMFEPCWYIFSHIRIVEG
jgi:hypothetical protein